MQVKKESFVKILDEVKAFEKEVKTLSANEAVTVPELLKGIQNGVKLLRKVRSLEAKKK